MQRWAVYHLRITAGWAHNQGRNATEYNFMRVSKCVYLFDYSIHLPASCITDAFHTPQSVVTWGLKSMVLLICYGSHHGKFPFVSGVYECMLWGCFCHCFFSVVSSQIPNDYKPCKRRNVRKPCKQCIVVGVASRPVREWHDGQTDGGVGVVISGGIDFGL